MEALEDEREYDQWWRALFLHTHINTKVNSQTNKGKSLKLTNFKTKPCAYHPGKGDAYDYKIYWTELI